MAHVRHISGMLLLILFTTATPGCGGDGLEYDDDGRVKVILADTTFWLEIAADTHSIENGLMGRVSIDNDGGMIFVFAEPRMAFFWMKDCLVDIDIIFLDTSGYVIALHEMKKEPPRNASEESEPVYEQRLKRYESLRPVHLAIELQAGMIEKLGIQPRGKLDLNLTGLKALAKPADQAQ